MQERKNSSCAKSFKARTETFAALNMIIKTVDIRTVTLNINYPTHYAGGEEKVDEKYECR